MGLPSVCCLTNIIIIHKWRIFERWLDILTSRNGMGFKGLLESDKKFSKNKKMFGFYGFKDLEDSGFSSKE